MKNILVVEEDECLGSVIEMSLAEVGVNVLIVRDELEGIDALDYFKPEVVICDVFPEASCNALIQKVKDFSRVVLLTSLSASSWGDDKLKKVTSADDVLRKPFDFEGLVRLL